MLKCIANVTIMGLDMPHTMPSLYCTTHVCVYTIASHAEIADADIDNDN